MDESLEGPNSFDDSVRASDDLAHLEVSDLLAELNHSPCSQQIDIDRWPHGGLKVQRRRGMHNDLNIVDQSLSVRFAQAQKFFADVTGDSDQFFERI